jgi:hypothetical protein
MRKLVLLLLVLSCLGFLANFGFKEAKATPITVTRTFQSLTSDGSISRISAGAETYADIWNMASGEVDAETSQMNVGQFGLVGAEIYRAFLPFDTSPLPDACNITSVDLSVRLAVNYSTKDFNVTVQSGAPNHPELPLQSGDYSKAFYSGAGGSRNTSTITAMNYWNITLNSTGLAWIDVDGTTKLCLRDDRDISGIEPTTYEFVAFYSAEMGASYSPILYVTYETEGYHYIVHGPYYENGAVANAFVNITLQIENMASNSTYLNGTDGVADTLDFQVEQRGVFFTWNISSAASNYTRTFYLTSATFEEIYIFIPNTSEEAAYLYTFSLASFGVDLNGSYIESILNVAGENRIVERQKADALNTIPFWFVWARHYSLRFVCSLGSYTWADFIALSETSQNLIVSRSMFPITIDQFTLYASAVRMNSTWIQVNYTNPLNSTSWVYIAIKHV